MNQVISRVKYWGLDAEASRDFVMDERHAYKGRHWLGPLSTVNVLIGPNNGGKSRLLRELFRRGPDHAGWLQSGPAYQGYLESARHSPEAVHEWVKARFASWSAREVSTEPESLTNAVLSGNVAALGLMLYYRGLVPRVENSGTDVRMDLVEAESDRGNAMLRDALDAATIPTHASLWRVFVPALRGLRPGPGNTYEWPKNHHRRSAVEDYFPNLKDDTDGRPKRESPVQLLTGLEIYGDVREHRNGPPSLRERLDLFEEFLARRFFGGRLVKVTARVTTDSGMQTNVLHMTVGNEKERPVYDLGDGLSEMVIVTWPMFLHWNRQLLLFVEEPETHLHAGLRRALMDAYLHEPCGEGGSRQVFMTTHSSTFLDLTIDAEKCTVFHVQKRLPGQGKEVTPTFLIEQRAGDGRNILGELGVLNSSVLLANCTVWVEGVTDRMYLRRYIQLHEEHNRAQMRSAKDPVGIILEDVHYAFVEYGGSNLAHWSFLDEEGPRADRLCGTLFLLADDDGVSLGSANPAKVERHRKLTNRLGDRFATYRVREIENLLTPAVLQSVVLDYEGPESPPILECRQEDYVTQYLGDFIERTLLTGDSRRPVRSGRPYAAESGTIKDKVAFAQRALKHLSSWDDLSPAAKAITERIVRFIREQNAFRITA